MTDLQDHPEYRQLVNAVRAAPDDDLPRLVLADWLEEHDTPAWAEFIRAQCEVARFPHAALIWADTFTDADAVNPEWQRALTCARRTLELWPEVARLLFAGELDEGQTAYHPRVEQCFFGDVRRPALPMYRVCRGFVERVVCATAQWVGVGDLHAIGPQLLARHPVREVVLRDRFFADQTYRWVAMPNPHAALLSNTQLPLPLAVHLRDARSGQEGEGRHTYLTWDYPSSQAAFDDLSAAAIQWALEIGRG